MSHAFSEQLIQLDEQFQIALKEACDPKRIQQELNSIAYRTMSKYVREATESYMNEHVRDLVYKEVYVKMDNIISQMRMEDLRTE